MDFRFTPEQEAFRREVSEFLSENLPEDWDQYPEVETGYKDDESWALAQALRAKAAERNWIALGWPVEYGGLGKPTIEQTIFQDEWISSGAPGHNVHGVKMLGPALMVHGSEEQKREYLPKIANAQAWWCQGYSEPGAGSDLASLETRAVEDGDDFVVNGSKIWTSGGHRADHIFMLVRTNPDAPKHKGISFLLSEMDAPGLTIRPIYDAAGNWSFNQLFFDNMRVPKRNLVGEQDLGWYVGTTVMNFERSGVEYAARGDRMLRRLTSYMAEESTGDGRLIDGPIPRNLLAQCLIDCRVSRMLAYNVSWMQGQGKVPNREASEVKVFGSEMLQRVALVGTRIIGVGSQLLEGSRRAPVNGKFGYWHLQQLGGTVGAGTSEIQRNVIATMGLGLPRA